MRIIAFLPDYNPAQSRTLMRLAEGIPGCELATLGEYVECDIAVICGGHKYAYAKTKPKGEIIMRHKGRRLLCVEEAFVRRGDYHQVGWGGFAGDADFNNSNVPTDRWDAMGMAVSDWRRNKDGHIVVMGQLGRDVQVQDTDHYRWVRDTIAALGGQRVIFRPHPKEKDPSVYGISDRYLHTGTMAEALDGARSVVTWNSTSAVDAILSGVPVVAMASSSIAYPVAGHTIADAIIPVYPDRREWLAGLGYSQWTLEEMRSGKTWAHLNG